MKKTRYARRGGFTLVEMLVVIAIIGIIAAFLVPTLYIVVRRAKENKIAQEINQLAMSIQSYKDQYQDIPPDCYKLMDLPAQPPDPLVLRNKQLFLRHLRRAFPRHVEQLDPTTGLPANGLPNTGTFTFPDGTSGAGLDLTTLDASEALVFWLAMIKNDPRNPLTGTSDPVPVFPFDEKRLIDLDGDGWLSYVPPDGKDMPYVYFDSRTYANAAFSDGGTVVCIPYATSTDENALPANWKFANATTFQIISAGLDGEYGAVTTSPTVTYKRFPFGDNYEIEDLDNIANFSDGKIFEDHME